MSNLISFEENKKPIWLLDRKTAFHMINTCQKDKSSFVYQWNFEECPKCGASYIADFGHKCSDTLRIKCDGYVSDIEEKAEKSNMVDFIKYLKGEEV